MLAYVVLQRRVEKPRSESWRSNLEQQVNAGKDEGDKVGGGTEKYRDGDYGVFLRPAARIGRRSLSFFFIRKNTRALQRVKTFFPIYNNY